MTTTDQGESKPLPEPEVGSLVLLDDGTVWSRHLTIWRPITWGAAAATKWTDIRDRVTHVVPADQVATLIYDHGIEVEK